MINWQVRIKNKNFWLAIIPAVLVLIQAILALFGVTIDVGDIGNKLIGIVNAAFVVLAILGIVADPTTEGLSDSKLAMTYLEPKKKDVDVQEPDEDDEQEEV